MTEPGTGDRPDAAVARQRAELAETVEELAHRVDVPARTKAAVHDKTEEAVRIARRRGPVLVGAAAAVTALFVVRIVRRRKRRR